MHHDAQFAVQLAVIIISAKLFGRLCERYLRQPSVIGEIAAGMAIGPYALGAIPLPGFGPLFPLVESGQGEGALHGLAIVAAVVLLFLAGLESDLKKFLRYSVAGVATGLGGAVLSFVLGAAAALWLGGGKGFADPAVLIMGTVATATSVGLTARVLADRHKMDTPEGATIVSAAVVDDVIGLIILGVVLSMSTSHGDGSHAGIPWAKAGRVAAKAGVVWVVMLVVGIVFARPVSALLKRLGSIEAGTAAALGLAFLMAGIAENAGMALIIGAYVMGLSLSKTDLRHELARGLSAVYHLFVPIFFCIMGMMVDLTRIHTVLLYGLGFAILAVLGKVVGCGLPALPLGFNLRGALRIGFGMAPRMEVALIVAGIAVKRGVLGTDAMGAVVLMVLVTAVSTPSILCLLFDARSGRRADTAEELEEMVDLRIAMPGPELADLVVNQMVRAFRDEQFYSYRLPGGMNVFELRKEDAIVYVKADGNDVVFSARPAMMQYVRFIALEEMVTLDQIFSEASQLSDMDSLKRTLLTNAPSDE